MVPLLTHTPSRYFLANNGAEDLIFGSGPATGQGPFDGRLDEVALYNYALSLSQVTNPLCGGNQRNRG